MLAELLFDRRPLQLPAVDCGGGPESAAAGGYAPLQLEEVDEEEVASLMEPAAEEERTQQPAAGAGGYAPLQVDDDEVGEDEADVAGGVDLVAGAGGEEGDADDVESLQPAAVAMQTVCRGTLSLPPDNPPRQPSNWAKTLGETSFQMCHDRFRRS